MFIRHDFSKPPFEDAAILMRYSQHLADGHGIVWNTGESPIDGATDFLFMVVLAGLFKTGLSLESSVVVVATLSHILMIGIIYFGIQNLYGNSRWMKLIGFFSAFWIVAGPGMFYIEFYFGTPFFALFICLSWFFAVRLIKNDSHLNSFAFAFFGLIAGLTRPEGVIVVGLMLLALLFYKGLKESKRVLLYFFAIFVVIGAIYFVWRWNYFGYPLPNPFYKKGGGSIYIHGLMASISNVILFSFPFIPLFLMSFFYVKDKKEIIFPLIPIIGYTLMWVFLSDEMNHLGRFQYAVVPIVLLSYPPILINIFKGAKEGMTWKPRFKLFKFIKAKLSSFTVRLSSSSQSSNTILQIFILYILISLIILPYGLHSGKGFLYNHHNDGRYDMGILLKDYSDKNYTIATSEAGLIPFYSEWRTIDTWGLNDQTVAHNGKITESYLDENQPDIIAFHGFFSPLVPPPTDGAWNEMILILYNYSESNGYILAASYGYSPYDTHFYYVSPNFPDSDEIINRIRSMHYYWPDNGKLCINFAEEAA
jgi:hypothetical protein